MGVWVEVLDFGVWDLESRVQGPGFGIWGQGVECRVWGLGFRVEGERRV